VQGGVERHAEELYTRLAARGVSVLVFTRSTYVGSVPRRSEWRGVALRRVWAPRSKALEAIWHTAVCVVLARAAGAQVLHLHAIGPGLLVPFARLLGLPVIFTHHGFDYRRARWGRLARFMLRLGEAVAVRWANVVLAVSRESEQELTAKYGREVTYAPNGVEAQGPDAADADTWSAEGVQPGAYAVGVGRLVPEKGWDDLFVAARAADLGPFVVVGGADTDSAFEAGLRCRAPSQVRLVGPKEHRRTLALLRGAKVLVLPSYHEGLPIAVLEAMAHGVPVVASDIRANRELITDGVTGFLFRAGDPHDLACVLARVWALEPSVLREVAARALTKVRAEYSWDAAAVVVEGAFRDCSRG
jgi:glycosyltransferase involved in cell wall biosynthesis